MQRLGDIRDEGGVRCHHERLSAMRGEVRKHGSCGLVTARAVDVLIDGEQLDNVVGRRKHSFELLSIGQVGKIEPMRRLDRVEDQPGCVELRLRTSMRCRKAGPRLEIS